MPKNRNIDKDSFRQIAKRFSSFIKKSERVDKRVVEDSWKDVEKMLFIDHSKKEKKLSYKVFLFSSAAALLLLLISISVAEFYFVEEQSSPAVISMNHIVVGKGENMNFTFSDGTKISVNAGSHVTYPSVFDKEKREIIVEGEVFLEVAPDPECPFIVRTNSFVVKVLGTAFNVSAYKDDLASSVVLVKGSVEIETTKKEKLLLHPNQLAAVTADGVTTENVNVLKYISWKDHELVLIGDKAGDVLNRLARYYGVDIEYDQDVANIPVSGKLDMSNSIENAINILEESISIQCEGNREHGFYLSKK